MTQNIFMIFRFFLAAVFSLFALYDDCRRYRISNRIIKVGMGMGLAVYVVEIFINGMKETYIMGAAITFFIMLVLYFLGGVGAGDVKLLTMLGYLLGRQYIVIVLLGAVFVGAVIGMAEIFFHRSRRTAIVLPGGRTIMGHGFHYTIAIVIAQAIVTFYVLGGVWIRA